MLANFLLVNLIRVDSGFTILDSVKNPKKTLYRDEHLTIQQLIHQVFTIIRNDKDFRIVFPIVISNVGFFIPPVHWMNRIHLVIYSGVFYDV